MALEIESWEIWHTYTTYLESTAIDLDGGARHLVACGLAECAMLQNGRTYWRSSRAIGSGSTVINVDLFSGRSTFRLNLDEGCKAKPEGFALEAWAQASYFLISERRVLGDNAALPPPYLRAYLGKCVVTCALDENTKAQWTLYPVLIVYESGILVIEFRELSPDHVTSLADFIANEVNFFRYKFDSVQVTPALSALATRAYYQSTYPLSLVQRVHLAWQQAKHDGAVRQRTEIQVDEIFSFGLAPLSGSGTDDLNTIARTVFHTAAFIISRPRTGLAFILSGQHSAPSPGAFWSGRPHIHVVRFREQGETASTNEELYGADFGRILSRVLALDENAARRALPKNGRSLQDYGAYITSAASLWVWSMKGLSTEEAWMDPNRGNLIYERQVLAELLEYGYMLHRSLYHRVETFRTTSEVMSVRREILQLRLKMREASYSGEVRELLENGWKELGLPDLIAEIDAGLRLRESETRSIEALRSTRVGWALTVVFGFVAVPALADQVVKPAWTLTPFHQFADPSLTTVVSDGIALLIVLLIVWVTLSLFSPRRTIAPPHG